MQILHLWLSDTARRGGGGAGSMMRIHSRLKQAGIDSRVLCQFKETDLAEVDLIPPASRAEMLLKRFTAAAGLNDIHRFRSTQIKQHPVYRSADIIIFHGLHSGFLSYLALPELTEGRACVLMLRDMWPLTGHCCCNFDCDRWLTGCGRCPYMNTYPPVRRDATHWEWHLKRRAYQRSKLTAVGISQWIAARARQGILGHLPIYAIPNGVETDDYAPLDQEKCRWTLGIPPRKKLLMCCSVDLAQHHKGGDLLQQALLELPESLRRETVLMMLGANGEKLARSIDMEVISLGYISNSRLKAVAYSAADAFVHPTRFEACGNVLLESLSCGTPMISFRVGGVPEIVRPDETGYLAEPENAVQLKDGIVRLLEDDAARARLGSRCRVAAVTERAVQKETEQYLDLFQTLKACHPTGVAD